ncbi:MAG: DNA polymerase Y family protein [Candidatus Melainabacteria bacterium]|nr:DNA polymerase Y family protein [Candidatus Melainabacteria bacterium]
MSRIACIRIPRFPIAAQQKFDPSLRNKSLVLVTGGEGKKTLNQKVVACSTQASKEYIQPGMRLSEARAICAELLSRPYDAKLYEEAQTEIARKLINLSPRVSVFEPGIFLLDASGLSHFGGESRFAANALKILSKLGYVEAKVGIADSAFAASVATRLKGRRWHLVPFGTDRKFIASVPVEYLPLSSESVDVLRELGIKSIGDFAGLSLASVAERFNEEGRRAHELALGLDHRRPTLPQILKDRQCSMEIGAPIESLNQTLFILKSLIDRLTTDLKRDGLCAEELSVSFFNEDDLFDERPIKLIAPTNSAKFLVEVIKLSLETTKLQREFTGVRVSVQRFCDENWQQSHLSISANCADEQLVLSEPSMLLLQRLTTRLGEGKVVQPQASDGYGLAGNGCWIPVIDTKARSGKRTVTETCKQVITPLDVDYVLKRAGAAGLISNLVLKKPREPVKVMVELKDEQPVSLAYGGNLYRISLITTPECLSGFWWDKIIRNSYYVAMIQPSQRSEIAESLVVLLAKEHIQDSWQIEGVYD